MKFQLSQTKILTAVSLILMSTTFFASPSYAQTRCGKTRISKQEVDRSSVNIDTQKFLNHVKKEFKGNFKGYAIILTGADGKRLGFRREGWAIDPCDAGAVAFDLNTETAIGSITKLFDTVAVLKATPDNKTHRLKMPLTHFLPQRWRALAHPFYKTVTIEKLLQHQGGFFNHGGGRHITTRLKAGRERSLEDYTDEPRKYSNTSMGMFHFLFAKYAYRSTGFIKPQSLHDIEVKHRTSSLDTYNREVQKVTSSAFNYGLYKYILKPLQISATCDPRVKKFPPSNSIKSPPNASIQHFPFFSVARSYSSASDNTGSLAAGVMNNCAPGGLYMSAKDLAKFAASIGDPNFLSIDDQERMMNSGPVDNLYGFNAIQAVGGRAFWHNGIRPASGSDVSYALLVRFGSGASAVFVASSSDEGSNALKTVRDAYNLARQ